MAFYANRFADAEEAATTVRMKYTRYKDNINASGAIVRFLKERCSKHVEETGAGTIASKILLIPDEACRILFRCVAAVGLKRWAPNFMGTPDSSYNLLHEHVAIFSFRQACNARVYDALAVDVSMAENDATITKLY